MKTRTFGLHLSAMAGALILLVACGGGGGGASSQVSAVAPAISVGGSVSGVAAKGVLANAIVTAYCGNGETAADNLAAGVTDAAGQYSLSWTATCGKPILLVVTAGANSTTADEATGTSVALPAGFKLRALVADPDTTAVKNITPLTDMAVAIAGASVTLSKAAAANAEAAVISTVLGGDIGAYWARPLAPTAAAMANASADERKLATMLTAVSAFAQDSVSAAACGALTGGTGAKIQCAIDALASQAVATVSAVNDAGYTVATSAPANTPAAMLSTALANITSSASTGIITAAGPQALAATITADSSGSAALLSSGNANLLAAAAGGGIVAAGGATGIEAARDLFNRLKNDLIALHDSTGSGYFDQKVTAMEADWSTIGQPTAAGVNSVLPALFRSMEMARYGKTKAATWTNPGTQAPYTVYPDPDGMVALVTDSTGAAFRFLRSFADGMNCYVNVSDMALGKGYCGFSSGQPNVSLSSTTFTQYFHLTQVVENAASSGSYTWQDMYASTTRDTTQPYINPSNYLINGGGRYALIAPSVATSSVQTGTATGTWNSSSGKFTAGTLKGNIQPLLTGPDYSTLDLKGAQSSIFSTTEVTEITGVVTNVKGAATSLSMTLRDGSQGVWVKPFPFQASGHPVSQKLVVQIQTTAFQYDGTLLANAYTANAIGEYRPTNATFSGKISTLAGGTATGFLSGSLGGTIANMSTYNPYLPTSATNFLKQTVTFGGKATNGGTSYELTFIADGSTYNQENVTLNYNRSGAQMVSITGTASPTASTLTFRGNGGVNAVLANGTGDVYTGTTKVGTITQNPSQVTFTDGTYLLLGI